MNTYQLKSVGFNKTPCTITLFAALKSSKPHTLNKLTTALL